MERRDVVSLWTFENLSVVATASAAASGLAGCGRGHERKGDGNSDGVLATQALRDASLHVATLVV